MNQIRVDNPIRSNFKADKIVSQITRKGVPRWATHPHEFRNYAIECMQQDKEASDKLVADYRLEDQNILTNRKARLVRQMDSRYFIAQLRGAGVNCFTYQTPREITPRQFWNTVGLWCEIPSERALGHLYRGLHHQYICYMDIPTMYEWSILRLDEHNLPMGEESRGWRTVLSQLIIKKVLTETEAHAIFGEPNNGTHTKIYKKTLYEFRNGRIKANDRPSVDAR